MISLLKETEDIFDASGIESPEACAEQIFTHVLGRSRIDLYTTDTIPGQHELRRLKDLINRRISGEPLQYVLGKTSFYGLDFKIKPEVFIPRPETEILVSEVIDRFKQPASILDLCTGCGNIAITLTKLLPHCNIFASDISKEAVGLTKENARLNGVIHKLSIRCGDIFKPWQDMKLGFDAICCNPPYIKTDKLPGLPNEVKKEPVFALDGGGDGLYFYKKIIKQAPYYLKDKGLLFFELDENVSNGVEELFKNSEGFHAITIVNDYNKRKRVIIAQWIK